MTSEHKSPNTVWHSASVTRDRRQQQNGHRARVLWFTGLSAAGKSTIAHALEERLHQMGCRSYVLDGDNVRHGLCGDLGFSAEDRHENIRRIGELSQLFVDAGIITLTAFISPLRADRERVRQQIGDDFVEIYCRCPVDVCQARDPRGLYQQAIRGEIKQFTGISAPYEEPASAEIVIDTASMSVEESVAKVLAYLARVGGLPGKAWQERAGGLQYTAAVSGKIQPVVAVVGLGYVGLPLAVAFGKQFETLGYDLSEAKVADYREHCDPTGEVSTEDFKAATRLTVSTDPRLIGQADIVIVAVPTPVDDAHIPDFSPLRESSATVGRHLKKGAIVVYESTVYPGATEEVCIPLLEKHSGLKWQQDFHVGYSPERVNPGDKEHTLGRIAKLVAGDDEATCRAVADLYASIITAGVHRTSSIKVAEAAKVIENTQRDLNIALMNELALIFDRMGIDTLEVLQAAGTKWNFLPFRPGLVGGHCIGVDPYYLTHKAVMLGYHPQVILAGRRINDGMAAYVAQQTVKQLIKAGLPVKAARVIVLGLTFKENCPDLRNSKVANVVRELQEFGCEVSVHDPIAANHEAEQEYGIRLTPWENLPAQADAIVAAVAHAHYLAMPLADILARLKPGGVFADVKSVYDPQAIRGAGHALWRL